MITLERAHISSEMLNNINYWQEDGQIGLEEDIRAIDDAITFMACERDDPGMISEKESLSVIAALSFLKRRLRTFAAKEE